MEILLICYLKKFKFQNNAEKHVKSCTRWKNTGDFTFYVKLRKFK